MSYHSRMNKDNSSWPRPNLEITELNRSVDDRPNDDTTEAENEAAYLRAAMLPDSGFATPYAGDYDSIGDYDPPVPTN